MFGVSQIRSVLCGTTDALTLPQGAPTPCGGTPLMFSNLTSYFSTVSPDMQDLFSEILPAAIFV